MSQPPLHILLIEDSPEDCADLRQMLLRGGRRRYRFSEARLGAEGMRRLLEPDSDPVDCVLLDYDLPDMNAHDVLAALRQENGLPPCPVVVVTGMPVEEGLQLLGAGAQDYIGKRWTNADSLTRAVENAIDRYTLQAERTRVQEAVRISEERYRTLFESIDAGYAIQQLIFDDNGAAVDARYVQVNSSFTRQSGLVDVVGRTLSELVPNIERQWLDAYATVVSTGVSLRMERYSQALQRWFDVFAFRLGAPQAGQVAVLFYDTTERKRDELALQAARADAESANRAKSDFLLSMSHELRSPLSAMLGFTQLLEAGTPAPTPVQQDSIEQILRAGWYLLGLINEILDLAAIESGKTVLPSQPMPLQGVLEECQAMIAPQAQGRDIRVVFAADPAPGWVRADPGRTKQVLLNLLSNAIKYNRDAGQVTVSTAVAGKRVRVSVEDTGAGLSAAQIGGLFQPFNRLGRETGTEPGTGIGLTICQRLVGLMGGSMGVTSTPGVGSCFWFELDAASPPRTHDPVPLQRTVLCIAKDAGAFPNLEKCIARWPGTCMLRALDVEVGMRVARSVRPDAILLAVHAADPGGAQLLRLLAEDPQTSLIPVIAVGVDATPRDVEAGLAAGCFSFFTQPFPSDAFVDALELALQHTHAVGRRAAAMESP